VSYHWPASQALATQQYQANQIVRRIISARHRCITGRRVFYGL